MFEQFLYGAVTTAIGAALGAGLAWKLEDRRWRRERGAEQRRHLTDLVRSVIVSADALALESHFLLLRRHADPSTQIDTDHPVNLAARRLSADIIMIGLLDDEELTQLADDVGQRALDMYTDAMTIPPPPTSSTSSGSNKLEAASKALLRALIERTKRIEADGSGPP
jgi:hypothetical protein